MSAISPAPALLARGPWTAEQVRTLWRPDRYEAPEDHERAADEAIEALRRRGSPSHDGVAARLADWRVDSDGLEIVLQPLRWALRLVETDACASLSALCIARDADGRWLAGRRAGWLATWPGRWTLGAGGAVDPGESPFDTLTRELQEEWSVTPERVQAEALIRLPRNLVMFVGQAWLEPGVSVTPDHEHDEYTWWPADVDDWPDDADESLRRLARLLT